MELAIIIPTKNEEDTLPYLISSIKEQSIKDFKIIVADANSKDKTRKIAKRYKCELVNGGTPSQGRNRGAEKALSYNTSILVFIDSDMLFPSKEFLEISTKEFKKRNLDIAATFQMPFDTEIKLDLKDIIQTSKETKDWRYRLFYNLSNNLLKISQKKKKPFAQPCIFIKKEAYEKIGGFDERIEFGEDSKYIQYAVKKGCKFGILNEPGKILISPRRFDKNGFWKMLGVYIYLNTLILFGHEFKVNGKIKYNRR